MFSRALDQQIGDKAKLDREAHVVSTVSSAASAAATMHDELNNHLSKEKEHSEKVEVHRRRESVTKLADGIKDLEKVVGN